MDTQVRPAEESVAFVEQLWREYRQDLQSIADQIGIQLPPELADGSTRPPIYDIVLSKVLEHLSKLSGELLQLPNGAEQFANRLTAMRDELRASYAAVLHQRIDECVDKRRRWFHWK